MTVNTEDTPVQNAGNDKEYNFGQLRKQLESEKQARIATEKKIEEIEARYQQSRKSEEIEDDDDEPYVDKKKLSKAFNNYAEKNRQETQSEIAKAVAKALHEKDQSDWLKKHSDFYDIMKHADKFAELDPDLASSILEMPEGFARQKLVYKNIKALGIHNPEVKKSSIQDTIDNNRRRPAYQPSSMGTPPSQNTGDFSQSGQKAAYEKMLQLKKNLSLG